MVNDIGVLVWDTPEVSGKVVPSPRSGHSISIVGRRAYLFGGCGEHEEEAGGYNDTYSLELSDMSWRVVETGGDVPSPRWRHSSSVVGNKIIVFGGMSKKERFSDTFLLDPVAEDIVWKEVVAEGSPPCPRAAHTATVLDDNKIVVFGGYGGHGQSRQFHNDLYTLIMDGESWVWDKMAPQGTAPKPRGSHGCNVINGGKYLLVYGGRDHVSNLDDASVLDLENNTWTTLEAGEIPPLPLPVSGGCYIALESVPSFKVFSFGGQSAGQEERQSWRFNNNVSVLDTKSLTWNDPTFEGEAPTHREDAAWAYDSKSSQLIVFGGWSRRWLNDLHTLKVTGVVGPPYAVTALEPAEGPITGQVPLTIRGLRFLESKDINVKFTDGRVEEIVPGSFVDSETIQCKTPVWEKFGAGEVTVRVSCRGEGYTVNLVKYAFYVNTRPFRCVAFGPGINPSTSWGFPAVFCVQAKDSNGRSRTSGGDPFAVTVKYEDGENLTPVEAWVTDKLDGTYEVTYLPRKQGKYHVDVTLPDTVNNDEVLPIRGSPWAISCNDPWNKGKVSGDAPKCDDHVHPATIQRKLVLHCPSGNGGDVHILDTDTMKWISGEPQGSAPAPRIGHSLTTLDNDKVLMYGGSNLTDKGAGDLQTSVYVLQMEKDGVRWTKPNDVHGPQPKVRISHSASLVPIGKKAVIFGGTDSNGEMLDDLNMLACANILSMEWINIKVAEGEYFPTAGHSALFNDGKLVCFGGELSAADHMKALESVGELPQKAAKEGDGTEQEAEGEEAEEEEELSGTVLTNQVLVGELDTKSNTIVWTRPKVSGPRPCPRRGCTLGFVDGRLILQGGYDKDGNLLDDLYALDLKTWEWSVLYASDGTWQGDHSIVVLVQKKLVALQSSRSTWDDVRLLEFGKQESLLQGVGVMIGQELRDLDKFLADSMKQLQLRPSEVSETDQFNILLRAMNAIYETKTQTPEVDLKFDVLREAVTFLERMGVNMDRQDKELKDSLDRWTNVKKGAPECREAIRPIQEREASKIRGNVTNFIERMKGMRRDFEKRPYFQFTSGVDESYKAVQSTRRELEEHNQSMAELARYAQLFDFPDAIKPAQEILGKTADDLVLIKQMWDCVHMIDFQFEEWKDTLWNDIITDDMEDGTKMFYKQMRALDKSLKVSDPFQKQEAIVKNFMTSIPLVSDLRHPSMRDRHWDMLSEITGTPIVRDEDFKLRNLLSLELHKFEEDVGEIVNRAQKEEKMEMTLQKIEDTWVSMEFVFTQHKNTDVHLVKLSEEDFETLEDHQVQVQNMMTSRYLGFFEERVTKWQSALATVADVVQILSEIQRTWAYLETLFVGSEEVKKELPEDTERFAGIHEAVQRILKDIHGTKLVNDACNKQGLFEDLEKQQHGLELCEKSLADYLEAKRRIFPRFFFVSTSDLLDILSNGNNPSKVMGHMPKIVAAIDHLTLDENAGDRPVGKGMTSCVGVEEVDFKKNCKIEGRVEYYLQDIIGHIMEELRDLMRECVADYKVTARDEWLFKFPNQVMLVTSMIYYCNEVEQAFKDLNGGNKDAMPTYNQLQIKQLTKLVEVTRRDLDRAGRQKVMCLITLDAHSRDIIQKMIDEQVTDPKAFQWQSQLRYSWKEDKSECIINIVDAQFDYGWEYLGNGPRLVITPLTDRLYVTATQSLHLAMGCAPAGPAGTGKTETTKDLAANMGKPVYVFNCSPEMDYRSMGDIFKGLAASGAWGCFDEFNRLIAEVLSVCSTQFKAVVDAIRGKRETFTIAGAEMKLNPACGAYITMNPGYLGRSELPESLKVLFRPVTVMVPDLALICENMLMAEGFGEAKVLARKFVQLYALLRDLLSKQSHYDWGLRAIKSVLVVAGSFKRAEPTVDEGALLFRALRDFNLPKIVGDDLVVFNGLLGDLFPGVDIPRKRDMDFEGIVESVIAKNALQPEPDFVLKVVQLKELLAIRHCVFILGTSGTAKTKCWEMLAAAQTTSGEKTIVRDLNPKAISTHEFYGYIQLATREWKDGIMSTLMRDLSNIPDNNPKWIILDGDLDANWIESMNSVMDDNKLLTLASNERIQLKPSMRLIFELRDLRFASPATVSRAGILYITEGNQWLSLVQSWVASREDDTPERQKMILDLFNKYVPETVKHLAMEFKHLVNILDFNMVQSLIRILDGLLSPTNAPKGVADEQKVIETYFVFAAVWAFGSAFSTKDGHDYRKSFSNWWKTKWTTVKFPMKGSVFDFFVDQATYKFNNWTQIVPEIQYSSDTPMLSVTVPTSETVSVDFMMDILIQNKFAVLLVGPAGCGKTAQVRGKLQNLGEDFMSMAVNFNYYTDSVLLQRVLEGPLEKKAGKNFGPPGSKRLVYFVDDLNMPQLDEYDTQTPIALLRQHFDYTHWYDRSKLTLKVINNVQFVSCMNPTAGSFNINPRLQRHYVVFAIGFPGSEALMTIFSTFLQGHLKTFDEKLQETTFTNKIIQAGLELHNKVASTFRKTAVNFHYEFSVRHLANVFQGMLLSQSEHFQIPAKLASLWVHESERVYSDRLVSPKDLQGFQKILKDTGKKFFKELDQSIVFPDTHVFCNFWKDLDEKSYNKIENMAKMSQVLEDALTSYNETNATMDLVLFGDAMLHIARICRIITFNNALLVGVGGSGKQSLARLSAFICGSTVTQIAISGNYGITDLKEDLKVMYQKSGVKSEPILFLFTDSQIADEKFLVYINELLASGDIPDLFAPDEKESLTNSVRNEGKSMGVADNKDALWDFFISKVRANLHVALCFSPVGEAFRRRASRFPALVNSTVIDWFQPWPEEALHSVAKRFLDEVDLGDQTVRDSIVGFMPFSFQAVNDASTDFLTTERRHNYTTPKSFLELIYLYRNMLAKKREEVQKAIDRLSNGLMKLEATSSQVSGLQEELAEKQVVVEEKKAAADELMVKVGAEKAKVGEEADKAEVEAQNCAVLAKDCGEQQRSCEADLAKAEPAVARAEAALDTLNKKDLGELKSLSKPPAGVDDITAALLAIRGEKDRSWNAAKTMMKDVNKFIDELKGLKPIIDEGKMNAKNIDQARPYLALEHFNTETMARKSKAAAGMCDFMLNIVDYHDIVVTVEPKRNALRQAQEQLEEANTKLAEVQAFVADLQAKLAELEKEFNAVVADKNAVVAEAEKLQGKLDLAMRLMNALGSENERWKVGVEKLNDEFKVLVGDVLLSSAFVSYIGCFNKKYRDRLLKETFLPYFEKHKVPASDNPDPLAILTNDAIIAGWNNEGLPFDRVSIENGTILTTAERWPLMIDPQLQGITWVKERESKNNLQVVRLGQKTMLPSLERALENGWSVLLENIQESLDAVLAPIIQRQRIKKGRNWFIKVGDKEVEFHPNFRLVLQTKLSNPHYPPEIQAECTLINFMVTEDGLEDQLLAYVVKKERPDLEEQKSFLIKQQNEFRIKLKELEDSLLAQLAEAEGDILENIVLIESLEEAKKLSTDIQEKVAIANETEIKINEARENYRRVANRGALLFFLLSDMFKIHQFYHYSLSAFLFVFLRAIDIAGKNYIGPPASVPNAVEKSKKSPFYRFKMMAGLLNAGVKGITTDGKIPEPSADEDEDSSGLDSRLADLVDAITFQVFNYTRQGLFERHKLIFATQLTLRILERKGELDAKEMDYLILGKKALSPPQCSAEVSTFISENTWAFAVALSELPAFSKLTGDLEASAKHWKTWANEEQPEKMELPGEWKSLSAFQKLLLLRALRPDRVTVALREFVSDIMGGRYVDQDPFDVFFWYKQSSSATPLFFYLFPGADVVKDLEPLLQKKGFSLENGKFMNISMGQGQEPVAEEYLDKYTKEGGWVFLQNVHLMTQWVSRLERKIEIAQEGAHPEFRCFLSAEPHPDPQAKIIPESIMQSSIKIANEPPQDIKANLLRAWNVFDQDFLDKSKRPKEMRTILLALCMFHSLVLGRRRFGFQGWSRGYSFNVGDLTICADVLYNQLEINTETPWQDLRYIFGEIMYGGHITDKWDRRTNNTYLEVLLQAGLFESKDIVPGFGSKTDGMHTDYKDYIVNKLPIESPVMFGLHPNAEIGFLTSNTDTLFKTIQDVTGGSGGGGGGDEDQLTSILMDYLERLPPSFNMLEVNSRVQEKTPYVVVALQELERMNGLLGEIRRSLSELKLGLEGALNISDAMEALSASLRLNRVPANWEKVAYASLKDLASWYSNLLERVAQMVSWSEQLQTPKSVWLSGLFNPMAFLTAVMQSTARANGWPLDEVTLQTDITKLQPEAVEAQPESGAYVHGLFLEGARWDVDAGLLKDSFLKDLHPIMPVINVQAIPVDQKRTKGYYECPTFYTAMRGGTYVFPADLRTDEPDSKWVLAGVAMLMNVE